jgi:phosphate uptake regulator/energy-coupling factor transporter transmembrane protein EcfT
MIKCSKCGAELSDDTRFCSYCGNKIEATTPPPIVEDDETPDASQSEPANASTPRSDAPKSLADKIKDKASDKWRKLNIYSKVTTVAIAVFVLLCLVAFLFGKTAAGIIAVLQIVLTVAALLMKKQIIKVPKSWIHFVALALAVVLLVPYVSLFKLDYGDAEKFAWSDILLADVVPKPESRFGEIIGNSSEYLSFDQAFPIIFGQNIGTCVTALMASIGANNTAKRAAVIHLLFNITGTFIFIIFLRNPVSWIIYELVPVNVPRQIAAGHIFFNLLNVVVLFPFSNLLVKASELIVRKDGRETESVTKYIDDRILATHSIALIQSAKEVLHLGNIVMAQFEAAKKAFIENKEELVYEIFEHEQKVNKLQKEILEYLVKLDKFSLTNTEKDKLFVMLNATSDIERAGDHIDNIGELLLYKIESKADFSEEATLEITDMFDLTMKAYKTSLNALADAKEDDLNAVVKYEEEIDKMYKALRKNHIDRLNKHICSPNAGIVFLDMISNLERVGDHSLNIAEYIMEVV